jgi:serine/threonine-protein kinase
MSPEQLRCSRDVDARADVWSLGVVLYELLTGAPPFNAGSTADITVQILGNVLPSIRAERHDLPGDLDAAVMRCLVRSPADRFQSVQELAAAIGEFGSARAAALVDRVAHVAATCDSAPPPFESALDDAMAPFPNTIVQQKTLALPFSSQKPEGRWPYRRRALVAAAVVTVALLVVGAAFRTGPTSREGANPRATVTEPPANQTATVAPTASDNAVGAVALVEAGAPRDAAVEPSRPSPGARPRSAPAPTHITPGVAPIPNYGGRK